MNTKLELVYYPDDRLRVKCTSVEEFNDSLKEISDQMLQIMKENNGIGLAAPQVGLDKRILVMDTREASKLDYSHTPFYGVMINPKITYAGSAKQSAIEGCLSFINKEVKVKRSLLVNVEWQDLQGKPKMNTFIGITARCVAHEIDHLNSVLFIDYSV